MGVYLYQKLKKGGVLMETPIVRELGYMPFAMTFETPDGNEELCNSTGYEVTWDNIDWWNEYEDNDGNLYYGR